MKSTCSNFNVKHTQWKLWLTFSITSSKYKNKKAMWKTEASLTDIKLLQKALHFLWAVLWRVFSSESFMWLLPNYSWVFEQQTKYTRFDWMGRESVGNQYTGWKGPVEKYSPAKRIFDTFSVVYPPTVEQCHKPHNVLTAAEHVMIVIKEIKIFKESHKTQIYSITLIQDNKC